MPAFAQWTMDHEVMDPVAMGRVFTLEEEYAWFDETSQAEDDVQWTVLLNKDQRIIGSCGLHRIHDPAGPEFGILIGDKREWGKRYAAEIIDLIKRFVLEELQMHRMHLKVFVANGKAVRAYERSGFLIIKKDVEPRYNNAENYHMELNF